MHVKEPYSFDSGFPMYPSPLSLSGALLNITIAKLNLKKTYCNTQVSFIFRGHQISCFFLFHTVSLGFNLIDFEFLVIRVLLKLNIRWHLISWVNVFWKTTKINVQRILMKPQYCTSQIYYFQFTRKRNCYSNDTPWSQLQTVNLSEIKQ